MPTNLCVPGQEAIASLILLVRGERVLLSQHLAELYGVPVKALNQAVKRNGARFPGDFMFQLTRAEFNGLKSQIVTSNRGGVRRALPYAFTEQGVAMLSSVLKSPRAIAVNFPQCSTRSSN
jgi:hypothetical protein